MVLERDLSTLLNFVLFKSGSPCTTGEKKDNFYCHGHRAILSRTSRGDNLPRDWEKLPCLDGVLFELYILELCLTMSPPWSSSFLVCLSTPTGWMSWSHPESFLLLWSHPRLDENQRRRKDSGWDLAPSSVLVTPSSQASLSHQFCLASWLLLRWFPSSSSASPLLLAPFSQSSAWPWCSDPPALPWASEPITPPMPFDPSAPPWLHAPLVCQACSSLRLGLGQSSFCLPHWLPGLWLHLIPPLYSFPRAPRSTVLSLAPPQSAEPQPPPWSRGLATPLAPFRPAVWPWVFVSLAPPGYPPFSASPRSVNHLLPPGLTTKAHPSDGSAMDHQHQLWLLCLGVLDLFPTSNSHDRTLPPLRCTFCFMFRCITDFTVYCILLIPSWSCAFNLLFFMKLLDYLLCFC